MKVAELIARLQQMPSDAVVVLEEDYGFDPVATVNEVMLAEQPEDDPLALPYALETESRPGLIRGVALS
jgi:hypothetical protein